MTISDRLTHYILGGIGGHNSCSGGNAATDCYSTRHMWRTSKSYIQLKSASTNYPNPYIHLTKDGTGEAYVYVDQNNQTAGFCSAPNIICIASDGVSIGRGDFSFATGAWNTIKQIVLLNSFDSNGNPVADGTIRVYHSTNGDALSSTAQIEYDTVIFRQAPTIYPVGIDVCDAFSTPCESFQMIDRTLTC